MKSIILISLSSAAISLPTTTLADSSPFFDEGSVKVGMRYRIETVDQDGMKEDATASTLKARVTAKSGNVNGFQAVLEVDVVAAIGNDDYNDATGEGDTSFPVVADPTGADLNQLYVKYDGGNWSATAGRQRINHGSQRFVGGVGWRQNEQTFDALRFTAQLAPKFSLDYSYAGEIQRIFGPDGPKADAEGDFHLFNSVWAFSNKHKLAGYAYLLDYDTASDTNSTYGLDYSGSWGNTSAHLAVANQSFEQFDANYIAADISQKFAKATVTLGYEQLGSDDGLFAFQTPLATGHKFQGFADKFLNTPANGIEDMYLKLATSISGVKLALWYHDFSSQEGSIDYGTEWNLVANYKIHPTTTLSFKFADYNADNFATDTTKFWLMVNTVF